MANSRKLPPNKAADVQSEPILNHVGQLLAQIVSSHPASKPNLLLGFSGGLDSAVLLHVLVRQREMQQFTLQAMHVHHGLSPHADDWAAFCERTCTTYQVPFLMQRVKVTRHRCLGIEAAAREARYQALQTVNADWLCLAHHQNDQAETVLLQLLRGAGVKGLAAMAAMDSARKWLRPLLAFSRIELEIYAKQHGLTWVEDESNADIAYDRNYLRHYVLPVLEKRYPALTQTLSRSAEHFAAASQLQDELAQLDLARLSDTINPNRIALTELTALSAVRQANVLRWWLLKRADFIPSVAQLQQMLQQIAMTDSDSRMRIKLAQNKWLRRYQNGLYIVQERMTDTFFTQAWHGEPEITLPDGSRLCFTATQGQGISARLLTAKNRLIIAYRQGGETFRPESNRPNRSLKSILQSVAMPTWQRERLPLILMNDDLVYVPNVGAAAALQALPGEAGYLITWHDVNGSDG